MDGIEGDVGGERFLHCGGWRRSQQRLRNNGSRFQKSDERWPALWPSWDADAPELKKANDGIAAEGSATDLTRRGHPVIVEAIDLPRKILQRMKKLRCSLCFVHVAACGIHLSATMITNFQGILPFRDGNGRCVQLCRSFLLMLFMCLSGKNQR